MGYNKITLGGGQICDYLYITKADATAQFPSDKFAYVDSEPTAWDKNTLLLSKFNGNLSAGNSVLTGKIVGYELRRRKGANSHSEYVTTIKETPDKAPKVLLDYAPVNNDEYVYSLYPDIDSSDSSNMQLAPLVTEAVETHWNYWSLMVVDETDEENVFYLDKLYKFELNLEEGDMNNNASVTVNQNFTPYPTVQNGASNYWSGSLTSLIGIISCGNHRYVQTASMIDEFKTLTTDNKRKFLKDIDGHIWEVKITDSISVSTSNQSPNRLKSVRVSWSEVADATGVSIINNPNIPLTEWVLTETGRIVPYMDYIWDDDSNWDDSCFWTEN